MSKALIPELLPLTQDECSDQQSQSNFPVMIDDITQSTGRNMSRILGGGENRRRSIVDASCRVSLLTYPTGIGRIDGIDFMEITSAEYLGLYSSENSEENS